MMSDRMHDGLDERAAPVLARLGLTVGDRGGVSRPLAKRTSDGPDLVSRNPANGRMLGRVAMTTSAAFDALLEDAMGAARAWRDTPAPLRGEAVRRYAELLREHKGALSTLVTLETGKIKAEGDGEVQEMIDIADFAVGQSRMLYGRSMHSERPAHRMYEQWHPLGIVSVITAFNFPVAVWAWNAFIAAICGNTVIWKPSPKTPLCAVAVQHICNAVMERNNLQGIFSSFITNNNELVKKFVEDKRVPLVSFTGSTEI